MGRTLHVALTLQWQFRNVTCSICTCQSKQQDGLHHPKVFVATNPSKKCFLFPSWPFCPLLITLKFLLWEAAMLTRKHRASPHFTWQITFAACVRLFLHRTCKMGTSCKRVRVALNNCTHTHLGTLLGPVSSIFTCTSVYKQAFVISHWSGTCITCGAAHRGSVWEKLVKESDCFPWFWYKWNWRREGNAGCGRTKKRKTLCDLYLACFVSFH